MDMSEAVAMRLKELCAARNMSLYELAYRSGVPESTLRHMADGEKANPKLRNIKRACDGFEISLADFFNTDDFKNLDPEYD